MRVTREVTYDPTDIDEITRKAVLVDASAKIGEPGVAEEWNVHMSSYGTSRVSIEKVEPPKPESEAQ